MFYQNRSLAFKLFTVALLAICCFNSRAQNGEIGITATITYKTNQKVEPIYESNGTITVGGSIQTPHPYSVSTSPQPWEQIEPLISEYEGRKIKRMLVQHATGKVNLFLKGKDLVTISKDAAIKAGLLKGPPIAEIIKVDTTLFVGEDVRIMLKKQFPADRFISINAVIDSTETPDEYRVQVNSPRELLILELGEDGKKLRVYQYNVAWSPDQKPPDSAEFYVGDIQSPQVDFNLFKKQNNITVTKGYRLTSATVYFSGTGFSRVYISKDSVFSNFQNRLIDLCLPGSVITYDMVSAVDPVGKTIMLPGRSYRLTDLNDVKDDYASLVVYPDFEGGDKALRHYVLKALEKFRPNELERGKYKFFFSVIVNTDGSLSDVYDEDPTKSEFEHICYYLIKNSTGWIPGTFRGQKVRMIAPVYLDIEVN